MNDKSMVLLLIVACILGVIAIVVTDITLKPAPPPPTKSTLHCVKLFDIKSKFNMVLGCDEVNE